MTGLGLRRLQRHAVLPQPGESRCDAAGGTSTAETGPRRGGADDLIQPVGRQRPAPPRVLSTPRTPDRWRRRAGVRCQYAATEAKNRRHRHLALMTALAIGDEHPPLTDLQILQAHSQAPHTDATRPTPSPRPSPGPGSVRNAPSSASPPPGCQDPRQRARRAHQRHSPPIAATAPRSAGRHEAPDSSPPDITTGEQIPVEPDTATSRRRTVRADSPDPPSEIRARSPHRPTRLLRGHEPRTRPSPDHLDRVTSRPR